MTKLIIQTRIKWIEQRREKVFAAILLLAVISRIYACFLSGKQWLSNDSYGYLSQADAIISGNPHSYMPNGYPLLIAGAKLLLPDSIVPVALIVLNIVLSTAVVLLTIAIMQRLSGNVLVQCGAGLLAALLPNQLNFVRYLYSEVPTTFLFVLGVYFAIREDYFPAGALIYLANIFRSTFGPVVPLYALLAFIFLKRWRPVVLLIAGSLAVATLYKPLEWWGIVGPAGNTAMNVVQSIGVSVSYSKVPGPDTLGRTAQAVKRYTAFAYQNPAEFAKQRALNLWDLWGPWPPAGDPLKPRSFVARAGIGLRFPLILLALLGFWVNRRTLGVWLCIGPIFIITVIHVVFYSEARYTYCVEPLAIVLACLGIEFAFRSFRSGETGESAVVVPQIPG